jgi:hypothetical protein
LAHRQRRRALHDRRPRVGRARHRRPPAFTLVFPAGVDLEAIRAQMETVEGELETVRTLVEASG